MHEKVYLFQNVSQNMKDFFYKKKIFYRKNNFVRKGLTLIFIHGLSSSSSAWEKFEKEFEKKFNVLSIDLRGHGKSFRPTRLNEYSIKKFSDDIYKIILKEKITKPILISHSFGNLVVFDFMKRHEKVVKALVLISPDVAPYKIKSGRALVPFLSMSNVLGYLPTIKKKGKHINYEKYLGTGDFNFRRLYADISNTGVKSYLYSMKNAYLVNNEKDLAKIKIPTLVIHGENDKIFPVESGKKVSKKIKNSKMVIIKKSDHILLINNFSRLIKEIKKFIETL